MVLVTADRIPKPKKRQKREKEAGGSKFIRHGWEAPCVAARQRRGRRGKRRDKAGGKCENWKLLMERGKARQSKRVRDTETENGSI